MSANDERVLAQANQRALFRLARDVGDVEKVLEALVDTIGSLGQRLEDLEVEASEVHALLRLVEGERTPRPEPEPPTLGVVPGGITAKDGGAL